MLGDPDADYINANYIDVSASPRCLLTGPGCSGFTVWAGRDLAGKKSGFMWLDS